MARTSHRGIKRCHDDDDDDDGNEIDLSSSRLKSIKKLRDYHQEQQHLLTYDRKRSSFDWLLQRRKKTEWTSERQEKEEQQLYDCRVYLKFYASTLKCTLDVVVLKANETIDETDSILLAKSRISKSIKPGVIRVRLVSSLFAADVDVHEDPSLVKLETIKGDRVKNNFDKQFALILKNSRLGPGVIGKLFVESLDPTNGSYNHEPPVFELNLILASEHEIVSTSSHQKPDDRIPCSPLDCGCILSSDRSRLTISDPCNLSLSNMKLVHRLAEPLRCLWKSIGRELSPCFSESDLIDFQRTYLISDGHHECAYQMLREWYTRDPHQATIRHLLTRLKLPFDVIVTVHNDVVRTFSSC